MSRTFGKVTFADGRERFFVHDSTVGYSYRPLFKTTDDAWRMFDDHGQAFVKEFDTQCASAEAPQIEAVRLAHSWGRHLASEDDVIWREEGLATDRALIAPHSSNDEPLFLLTLNGLVHLGYIGELGFAGRAECFRCDNTYHEMATSFSLDEAFGQAINWCHRCTELMRV